MIEKVASFKERLNQALKIRDIRPVDLARKTKISESTISQYRSGYAEPKEDKLAKIADALSVNPAWLMGLNVFMEINESHYYDNAYDSEIAVSRLEAIRMRDYWAYHILEVGDKIPVEGQKDIEVFADFLAKKYNVKTLSPNEVDELFVDTMI